MSLFDKVIVPSRIEIEKTISKTSINTDNANVINEDLTILSLNDLIAEIEARYNTMSNDFNKTNFDSYKRAVNELNIRSNKDAKLKQYQMPMMVKSLIDIEPKISLLLKVGKKSDLDMIFNQVFMGIKAIAGVARY